MNKHLGYERFCYCFALSLYNQLDHKEYPGSSSKKIDLIKKYSRTTLKNYPNMLGQNNCHLEFINQAFVTLKLLLTNSFKVRRNILNTNEKKENKVSQLIRPTV